MPGDPTIGATTGLPPRPLDFGAKWRLVTEMLGLPRIGWDSDLIDTGVRAIDPFRKRYLEFARLCRHQRSWLFGTGKSRRTPEDRRSASGRTVSKTATPSSCADGPAPVRLFASSRRHNHRSSGRR